MGIGLSTGTMEYDDGRRGVFEGREQLDMIDNGFCE